ncbi:MAG: Retaining alpha-galactosidase, partial [Pedobacter sp.]
FHGAYKPTGLQRTYPNVVNFEGVFGLEQLKWTEYKDMPVYDVTMPFIRMLAGPMDYTEGAMRNANKKNWRAVYSKPMSQGTRCHQLALYVLLESPFLMLCDDPTAYEQEKECTDFMASIPTTFDETIALDGKVGEYASVARRKGDTWYICGMNNWSARQFSVPLTFLKEGTKYSSTLMVDGINASRDATDYKKIAGTATRGTIINGEMAEGGGWVMILEPIKPRP